jgi:hypothetical protein
MTHRYVGITWIGAPTSEENGCYKVSSMWQCSKQLSKRLLAEHHGRPTSEADLWPSSLEGSFLEAFLRRIKVPHAQDWGQAAGFTPLWISEGGSIDAHYRPILSINNIQINGWAYISYTHILVAFYESRFLAENKGQSQPLIQGANMSSNKALPCRHHMDWGPTKASNRHNNIAGMWKYNRKLRGKLQHKGGDQGLGPLVGRPGGATTDLPPFWEAS